MRVNSLSACKVEETYSLNGPIPNLLGDETQSIIAAVEAVQGMSGTALSDWSHEQSNSWKSTGSGEELNIYSDLMSPESYAAMKNDQLEIGKLVMNTSPDVKSSEIFIKSLIILVKDQGFTHSELEGFSWFLFRDYDHLKTNDPVKFLAHAVSLWFAAAYE